MSLVSNIKDEAKGNKTIIQSTEGSQLAAIFNRMFYLEKNPDIEAEFVKQVSTRGQETQERSGLHASAMLTGDKQFCLRQQVLSLMYKQLQGEQVQPDLKRIFEEGNAVHEKWQRLFLRAGYSNLDDLDVTRFWSKYRISYTPDIVCKIPEFFDGRMVGEIKSVNTFQFQKMGKHPSAWKQLYWYSYLCIKREKAAGTWNGVDYTKGFVLDEDKNTQQFKVEVYDFDIEKIKPFVNRCRGIKQAYIEVKKTGNMVPRPSDAKSIDCKRCSQCPMRDACWLGKKERL